MDSEEDSGFCSSSFYRNRLALCQHPCKEDEQNMHIHGFLGSTGISSCMDESHCHKFAGYTGEAVPLNESHIHIIRVKTDYLDHLHEIRAKSGTAIHTGNGRHIHLVTGETAPEKEHTHNFIIGTLTETSVKEQC